MSADLPLPIPGLEGPFRFKSGRVAYWDPREGKYYDRGTDMYLTDREADLLASAPPPWGMGVVS